FPGTHAIERAWAAHGEGRLQSSGAMTHFVPDEGVDSGPVIDTEPVGFEGCSSLEDFEAEMHEAERRLVARTVEKLVVKAMGSSYSPKGGHMPTALLSVFDKTGLVELARSLARLGWDFLASGGTARALKEAGIDAEEISDYTGAAEILGGRVKTLHPAVHGGILARAEGSDLEQIAALGYKAIDLVVVDLYPFQSAAADPGSSRQDIIEKIDIGGVALIRAAAKNHDRVAILCDPADYSAVVSELVSEGSLGAATRARLAAKAFAKTAAYDTAIAAWFASDIGQPPTLQVSASLSRVLRYGENPHQKAELYTAIPGTGPLGGAFIQGKELSYNNLLDLDAAWAAAARFSRLAAVVVKHLSPCGIAESADPSAIGSSQAASCRPGLPVGLASALERAIACDPVSAFGGVIAVNSPFTASCARALGKLFVECIAAPAFEAEALQILAERKNLRLVVPGPGAAPTLSARAGSIPTSEIRSILGGFLRQDLDLGDPEGTQWTTVSKREPTPEELEELRFAWKACISVKSNAIVLARGGATVGIGAGQPNRVDSVRLAVKRAGEQASGSVLASDAFFPFPDSVEEAAKAGVTAIVHPGGSLRDAESLKAADDAGMAMVITGVRHFRH
ncbi:MAG TPA: bifunctional phosphoribosylaminoimidazolecarboxamide formyltransferase/IMP cyclohydrolase, partial [Rectinemataceae bacterium]